VVGGASTQASVDAKGMMLTPHGLPTLPVPLPLKLQVLNEQAGAGCFSADFPTSGVKKNDPVTGKFIGKGGP
jgi:hypothetical protein